MTATPAPVYTVENYIADLTAILQEELGMKGYEAYYLTEELKTNRNFFEFWFSGEFYGSYKLYLDGDRTPYIFDQHNNKAKKETVERVNLRIKALSENFS